MTAERVYSRRRVLRQRAWVLRALRDETFGGVLLLIGAVLALIIANGTWSDTYFEIASTRIGPVLEFGPLELDLNLKISTWAADGLLAIFFFVAGVELRHELELGSLANPARAAVPLAAAIGGMLVPALIYTATNAAHPDGRISGWGIPMATDIAFALAVLAVVGRSLPVALRAFLLSLAVVDDLGAIMVIAVFYSSNFHFAPFLLAVGLLATYAVLQQRRFRGWPVYLGLVLLAWAFMHESGVHATIAGVAAGLLTRVTTDPGEDESPGARAEHVIRPISAGFAVPVFAFFAAGVSLSGTSIAKTVESPVALGVFLGLVVGKPIGVVGTAWLMARFTRAELSRDLRWADIGTVGLLAGIGFTVSLLIAELAFAEGSAEVSAAKLGVLLASLTSAVLATIAILGRNRHYRELSEEEDLVYERELSELEAGGLPPERI